MSTNTPHRERACLYTSVRRVAGIARTLAGRDSAPGEPPERLTPTEVPERLVPDDVPETPPGPATTPDPGPPQRV